MSIKHCFVYISLALVEAGVQESSFCIGNFRRELDCRMMIIWLRPQCLCSFRF